MEDEDERLGVARVYRKLEIIGRGAYGAVYKGQHKTTGKVVALKILNLDTHSLEDDFDDIQREIALLSTLRDAEMVNVVQYYGSHLYGSKLWIVMDYAQGGSIRTLMKAASSTGKCRIEEERLIAIIARESLIALSYLHKNGIIHRDIKAANILLTKAGRVLLCDFGVAATLSVSQMKRNTFVGTPYWMAPEVIQTGALYDTKADCWSLGITIYEMACGNPPHVEVEPMRAITIIPTAIPPRLPEGPDHPWSKEMRDFVVASLNEVPSERASAEELSKSRWIKNNQKHQTSLLAELVNRYDRWQESGGKRASLTDTYRDKVKQSDSFDFDDELNATARPDSEFFNFNTIRSSSRTPSSGTPVYYPAREMTPEGPALHPLQQLFKSDQELESAALQSPMAHLTAALQAPQSGVPPPYTRPESPSKTLRPSVVSSNAIQRIIRPRADSKGAIALDSPTSHVAPPMLRSNTSQGFDQASQVTSLAMSRSSSTGIDSPVGPSHGPGARARAMTRPGMPGALKLVPFARTELPTIPASATATSFPSAELNAIRTTMTTRAPASAGLSSSASAQQLSSNLLPTKQQPAADDDGMIPPRSAKAALPNLVEMPPFPPLDEHDKGPVRDRFQQLRTKGEVQLELSRQLTAVLSRLEALESGFGLLLT